MTPTRSGAAVAFLLLCAAAAYAQDDASPEERQRILNCPVWATSLGECEPLAYLIRAAIYFIPPALIGVGLLFSCPFYFCCKYCCNCCGGSKPSKGCCGSEEPPEYSQLDYTRPKAYMVILSLLAFVNVIWGLYSGYFFSAFTRDFAIASGELGAAVDVELGLINQSMIVRRYHDTNDTYFLENLYVGSSLEASGNGIVRDLNSMFSGGRVSSFLNFTDIMEYVLYAIVLVPSICIFVGTGAGLCGKRKCLPMFLVVFLFFFGTIVWLLNGVFAGMALIATDACAEFKGVSLQQRNLVPLLFMCSDSTFTDFQRSFKETQDENVLRACESMVDSCYWTNQSVLVNADNGQVFDCPSALNDKAQCPSKTFGELLDLAEVYMTKAEVVALGSSAVSNGYMCRSGRCNVTNCAHNCLLASNNSLSRAGRRCNKVIVDINAAIQIGDSMDSLGAKFADCNSAFGVVIGPFIEPCDWLGTSMVGLRGSMGILGLSCIGSIFALVWGAKRFEKYDPEKEAQEETE